MAVLIAAAGSADAAVQPKACPAIMMIYPNGSAELEGKTFNSRAALKPYLIAYKKQHPNCALTFTQYKDTPLGVVGAMMLTLQEAGFNSGVLIEPREIH